MKRLIPSLWIFFTLLSFVFFSYSGEEGMTGSYPKLVECEEVAENWLDQLNSDFDSFVNLHSLEDSFGQLGLDISREFTVVEQIKIN